jgi:hypothetical protein
MAKKSKVSKAKKAKKKSRKPITKKRSKRIVAKRYSPKKLVAKKATKKVSRKKGQLKVSKTAMKNVKRKLPKKAAWKISPEKYAVTDMWVFRKESLTIELSQNYRFSFLIVAQKPKLTKYDPDKGANIDKFKYSYYESGDDARGPDWTFPDDFSLEEQERIKSLWDKEYDDAMREAGWTCSMETYLYGPLLVEEVEAEYPHNRV